MEIGVWSNPAMTKNFNQSNLIYSDTIRISAKNCAESVASEIFRMIISRGKCSGGRGMGDGGLSTPSMSRPAQRRIQLNWIIPACRYSNLGSIHVDDNLAVSHPLSNERVGHERRGWIWLDLTIRRIDWIGIYIYIYIYLFLSFFD